MFYHHVFMVLVTCQLSSIDEIRILYIRPNPIKQHPVFGVERRSLRRCLRVMGVQQATTFIPFFQIYMPKGTVPERAERIRLI
mgnify:CR=1 FL=1